MIRLWAFEAVSKNCGFKLTLPTSLVTSFDIHDEVLYIELPSGEKTSQKVLLEIDCACSGEVRVVDNYNCRLALNLSVRFFSKELHQQHTFWGRERKG